MARILLAGDWHSDIHEEPWARAFEQLGHEVERAPWYRYFAARGGGLRSYWVKAENKLIAGPDFAAYNIDLVRRAARSKPDAVVLYRPTHVLPSVVRALRVVAPKAVIATYNNDDPFGPRASRMLWRHYNRLVRLADVNMVYRHKNVSDLRAIGARNVHVIRSSFLPEVHRPIPVSADDRKRLSGDVVFLGHFEPDGRLPFLRAVAATGVDFRLFGPDWDRAPREPWLDRFQPIRPLRGEDYVRAIAGAKIALSFLSGMNHDTYTRRCFEIPAIGTMMLCQRTEDMQRLFTEGVEADYFSSPDELTSKIRFYLADEVARSRVAAAGRARVIADGHDVVNRVKRVIGLIEEARRLD